MGGFERQYYEAESFWAGGALSDERNLLRIRLTAALIPRGVTSLADIGCGNGVFANHLRTDHPSLRVLAIDRSYSALKYVNTEKAEGDITAIPLADRSFDCVTCLEVIEHLPVDSFQRSLDELARVARTHIIISVPYAEDLERTHTQCPQCMSIFNADLHLRTFTDSSTAGLLESVGFRCVSTEKTGEQYSFKGHDRFERLFYPGHFRLWRSPICPICGYRARESDSQGGNAPSAATTSIPRPRSLISYFTTIPKLFWPKELTYYWIIALYERS